MAHALVTVGGYEFPEPSTYNGISATIVDSARAMGFVRPMADLRKLSFVTVYVK